MLVLLYKGVNTFSKRISTKVKIVVQLMFELVNYYVGVQHTNHNTLSCHYYQVTKYFLLSHLWVKKIILEIISFKLEYLKPYNCANKLLLKNRNSYLKPYKCV